MSDNNTKHPNSTVPTQNNGQPAYSQGTTAPNGALIATNASQVGQTPINKAYPHS